MVSLEVIKIASENILKRKEATKECLEKNDKTKNNKWTFGRNKQKSSIPKDGIDAKTVYTERVLKRFRNSYVNLARPVLFFAQPVEVESYSITSQSPTKYSIWDRIMVIFYY